jgi:hypothetical protein
MSYGQFPAMEVISLFDFSTQIKNLRATVTGQSAICEKADGISDAGDSPNFISRILASIFSGDSGATIVHGGFCLIRSDPTMSIPRLMVGCIVYQGTAGDRTLQHTRVM